MIKTSKAPKFLLGQVVATPGALVALRESHQSPLELLGRHMRGDWGEKLCPQDRQLNNQAVVDGPESSPHIKQEAM